MPENTKFNYRLSKAAKEFNMGKEAIVKFLAKKGFQIDSAPNTKLTVEMHTLLVKEYQGEKEVKYEAMKLGNLSYKRGSASVESIIDNVSGTAPANEKYKERIKQKRQKKEECKLKEQEELVKKQEKSKESNMGTKDEYDAAFSNAQKEKGDEKEEKTNKLFKTKVGRKVPFNTIRFSHGFASITYKRRRYYYKNPKIRNYDKTIRQIFSRLSKARRDSLNAFFVEVIIDIPTETFTFKNLDICDYVNELKESCLPENNKTENRNRIRLNKAARMFNVSKNTIVEFLAKNGFIIVNPLPSTKLSEEMYKLLVKEYHGEKDVQQKPSTTYEKMTLGTSNIHFYNGYYLIFQTTNGEADNSITPYRVNDPNSHEILNLVHGYFERKLEQLNIIVKHDKTTILEPSKIDQFQLSNYVRFLNQNLDGKGGWWEEVQNARKRSFVQCFGESTESVKKRVAKSKNEFLYNLSSLQNEKKLIRVYEINHGKEEDAFIFTISMSNNRCAIVFENASKDASTTTWIFVAKDENYEPCINLVFDYFTDYTISLKRSSLRSTINPPEKFKAESYAFIYHDDIGQWLKKLNKILGQTPKPSEIQFVPGLHIPESSETRTGRGDTITTKHLHNQLMRKLYDKLCVESGKDNVGTEIRVGAKRIDTVVKGKEFFDIYEIKTATNPFDCVTEALGQLCQYAYLYCPDKIGKLVIVGPSETTKEVEQYLSTLRKNHSLQLYYMKV